MRILNSFAGIGGNRKLWSGHEVTAVEIDLEVAKVYANRYVNDVVINGDALKYIEDEHVNFDFIWASPSCPSHGQYRFNVGVLGKGYKGIIPDMTSLYGVITFLKYHSKCLWVVENTIPYYEPLIEPTIKIQRHLFWANFNIDSVSLSSSGIRSKNKISDFVDTKDVITSPIKNKRQVLRNCVDEHLGLHILACAERKYYGQDS